MMKIIGTHTTWNTRHMHILKLSPQIPLINMQIENQNTIDAILLTMSFLTT